MGFSYLLWEGFSTLKFCVLCINLFFLAHIRILPLVSFWLAGFHCCIPLDWSICRLGLYIE